MEKKTKSTTKKATAKKPIPFKPMPNKSITVSGSGGIVPKKTTRTLKPIAKKPSAGTVVGKAIGETIKAGLNLIPGGALITGMGKATAKKNLKPINKKVLKPIVKKSVVEPAPVKATKVTLKPGETRKVRLPKGTKLVNKGRISKKAKK